MKTSTILKGCVVAMQVISTIILTPGLLRAEEQKTILTIGDSLTAGLSRASDGVITCIPLDNMVINFDEQEVCKGNGQDGIGGYQPALRTKLNKPTLNFGNSSETTEDIKKRLQAALKETKPSTVFLLAGTNDVIRGIPLEISINNIKEMIEKIKENGSQAIVGTIPPLAGGRFREKEPEVKKYNDQIRKIEGAKIADIYNALITNWEKNTSGDFVHLGELGNAIAANTWAAAMNNTSSENKIADILPAILMLLESE